MHISGNSALSLLRLVPVYNPKENMFIIEPRQGFGLDIEFNQDICHIADTDEVTDGLFAFIGIIILLPFIKIYLGEMNLIGGKE